MIAAGGAAIVVNSPHKAVLFADVCDSTSIYETLGDTRALALINRLFRKLEERIGPHSGALAKTLGDSIVCHFPQPDAAFHTACEMQNIALDGAIPGQPKLSIKIGFTYGPVIPKGTDVFGDTVNVCARLVSLAAAGQVLTTRETVEALPEGLRSRCRQLYPLKIKGRTTEVTVCDVVWRPDPDITATDSLRARPSRAGEYVCKLVYAGGTFIVQPNLAARLGRDKENDLVVTSARASRSHARVYARDGHFFIADQSANGTYLLIDGNTREVMLKREEALLGERGWIGLGDSAQDHGEHVLRYRLERR
jgi:class 3 adenylate cyclase